MRKTTKYQISANYLITAYDEDDRRERGDDLQKIIDEAERLTKEDGAVRYITEVIRVVKPVKNPYEVTIEEYK